MNTLQTLVRVADLMTELRALPRADIEARLELETQIRVLLVDVGSPPPALLTEPNPMLWAAAFAETFPLITSPQVFAWFAGAMQSSHDAAERAAYEAGCKAQLEADQVFIKDTADVMNQLRDLVAAGLVRDIQLKEKATGETIRLSDLINRGRRG